MIISPEKRKILIEANRLNRLIDNAITEVIKIYPREAGEGYKVEHEGRNISFKMDYTEEIVKVYSNEGRPLSSYPFEVKGSFLAGLERDVGDFKESTINKYKAMQRIIADLNLDDYDR